MKKKLLALLLAALMVVSLIPMTVFATGTSYAITNGTPESAKETNHGYITVSETAAKGDKVEVTVVPNNGYKLKSLVYSPTPKTVADILPEEFPAAETDASGAPATAWKSAMLDQLCYISYDKTKLFFYTDAGIPDKSFGINTDAVVSADEDENYVYKNGTVTVTFFMKGENGTLNSVTFANTANTTWNGTYQKSACVAAGTVIAMYNGEQKKVEDLEIGDVIRTFDHEKGEVSSSPVCFIWESKNAANAFTLTFEGNINVTVIEAHGFYDCDENRYVFINVGNAKDYIGHHFYNADTDSRLELKNIEIMNNCIDAYAVATSKHLNHLSNGMLSMCDGTFEKIANLFEYDNQMKYDAELMKKDIEDYGLTPPEKVLKYKGFNKADYYDYNLQYLDIALGKGLISYEWIEALSEYCIANNIYDILPVEEAQNGSETKKMRLMFVSAPKKMLVSAPNPAAEDSVEIKADTQGKYIFTMPAQNVTVTAEFEKISDAELIASAAAGTLNVSVPGVVDVAVDQLGTHTVKLLKTVDIGNKEITVAQNVFFDFNHFKMTTTGKMTNNGVIILHQENADIVEDLLYKVPGNYAASEELKLPNDASPDYVIPASTFMTSEVGTDPAYQELSFASGDEMLVWNKDVTAGVQIDVAYSLTLGGDILGAKGNNVKPTKATAINVALGDNITIGGNNGEGEASLVIESLPADDLFPETIGTFTANGKKITLNKSGKLVISANITFDEFVLVSGVNGMVVAKTENKKDGNVTYFLDTPHAHNPVKVDGKAATIKEAGFKSYYKCDCGKFFEDATCKVEITDLAKWKAQGGNGYIAKLEKQTDPTDPKSPQTGDTSNMTLWVMLLALSSMGLCACLVLDKKRKNEQ